MHRAMPVLSSGPVSRENVRLLESLKLAQFCCIDQTKAAEHSARQVALRTGDSDAAAGAAQHRHVGIGSAASTSSPFQCAVDIGLNPLQS